MPWLQELGWRVVSATLGIPLILLLGWWDGWALLGFLALLYWLGLREMALLLKISPAWSWLASLFFLWAALGGKPDYELAILPVAILLVLLLVLLFPRFSPREASATFLASTYLSFLLYPYFIRSLPHGWTWFLLLLFTTWACDTAAYFAGRLWGKRRLVPTLSPGKTVEGAVAGLVASVLVALSFTYFLSLTWWRLGLLGGGVGIVAQLGDLVLSAVKRAGDKKDAGNIIPGHGGILDRFDSLLLTAPLVYYFICCGLRG
ncbi:phosphatidate cytidylyltransferase [Desulfothermobacter acidiphilus]|uniref:phosphatidate cytidylyltransferase n=1 Tax=Desulfothermobacter acidiphilus TaxID=1938353 RepID=UPI003F886C49